MRSLNYYIQWNTCVDRIHFCVHCSVMIFCTAAFTSDPPVHPLSFSTGAWPPDPPVVSSWPPLLSKELCEWTFSSQRWCSNLESVMFLYFRVCLWYHAPPVMTRVVSLSVPSPPTHPPSSFSSTPPPPPPPPPCIYLSENCYPKNVQRVVSYVSMLCMWCKICENLNCHVFKMKLSHYSNKTNILDY